ncbi:unnamed protein product [Oppiella nova]|uniref:Beta-lactamase-related domain-containing protein n=1 Tax=Oppiella nova TaxID=334625 RepID=A0A7R9QY23_9ACAR|nr:unnamed protein product [Oppiella nova]CAG2179165.1 unnamed protein product [Oppiella nova]
MTLGQVMSHSAGLKVTDLLKDFQMIYDFKNVSQSLVQFVDEPLLSEPGTQYNYSNYGYQVVGAIIESVINDEYFNAINKMFEELKMNSTFCETSDMIIRHRVHDYLKSDYPILPDPTRNASEVHLMNALVIDDLLAMEAQWPAGEYLKSSTVKQIWDPVIEKFRNKYGLSKEAHGWAVTELDRPIVCQNKCQMPSTISRFIWKTGGLTGVTNILMILPDQDIIVALLTNTSDVQDDIVEAALMVAKEFMN